MHFEIRSALQSGKQLTPRQRASGFSEAPTVAGKVLRRGMVLRLSPDQVKLSFNQIRSLLGSQSVIVDHVNGEYHRTLTDLTPGLLAIEISDESPVEDGEGTVAGGSGDAGGESRVEAPEAEEAPRHDLRADIQADAPSITKAVLTEMVPTDSFKVELTSTSSKKKIKKVEG